MLRTILVPLDGSELAGRALPIALDLARRTGGTVHLVRAHVSVAVAAATAEGALLSTEMIAADQALRGRAREDTEATARRLGAEWGTRIEVQIEDGSPAAVIVEAAEKIAADLIVMTTHGEGGFTPGWLGSVTDSVIRHSHRPVLALPANDSHGGSAFVPRSILVTQDGSERSEAILPVAREFAVAYGARLELIRVIAPYVPGDVATTLSADRPDAFGIDVVSARAKEMIEDQAARMRKAGLDVTSTVRVQLSPTRCLLDHVKETDPDCIAIASQGRGLSRFFLGSVADKLLRAAGRPVLVLRPPKA